MSKARDERLWYLRSFSVAWGRGHMGCYGKKWDAHKAKLLKDGYLEADENGMFRMTEKGQSAINGAQ